MLKRLLKLSEKKSLTSVEVSEERPRPSYSILTNHIKNVFYEKAYAEYVAGTLTFKISYPGIGPDSEDLIFCNFKEESAPEDYLFWLAACYLKYKSPTTHHYPIAQEIIQNYSDPAFAARIMLELE